MEAPYHAPPAPHCLCQWRFMPLVWSTFASQDIREIPQEKTIAYAWALQYYTEWSNLLRRNQPCLLVDSVLELREEVRFYLSFQDEEVFWGLDLPKKEEDGPPTIAVMAVTNISDTADIPEVSPALKTVSKYPSWETVLHSSQPVYAAGETAPPTPVPKPRRRPLLLPCTAPVTCPSCPSRALLLPMSSPPPWALALTKSSTHPRGFTDVTSCLRAPKFKETDQEAFEGTTSIGLVATPGISSVCTMQVMKDDKTGLVYMDTITTLVGQVVLGADPVSSSDGPVIEDITKQLEDIPPNNQPVGEWSPCLGEPLTTHP